MNKLIEQLKRHEGAVKDKNGFHTAYRCPAGKLTVGYGHNLEDYPVPGIGPSSRLNENQAERLLMHDVEEARRLVTQRLPKIVSGLNEARRAVLVAMAFNLGIGGLLSFKKMLAALEHERYGAAAGHMLDSRWARQVGGRASELAAQMETGEWRVVKRGA